MHLRGVQKATGQRWHQEGLQRTTIKPYWGLMERKKRNMASQESNNGGTISFEARWGKTMHLRGVQKATGQRRRERREIWLPRKATTGGPYLLKPDGGRRCTSGGFRRLQGNVGEKEEKYGFPGKQQRGDHIFWSQMGEDDAPQGGSEGYRATSERKKRNMASQESNKGGTISFEARWGKTMHLRGVQKATGQRRRERREIWLPREATTGGQYLLKPDGGRRCTSGGFRRLQGNVGEKEEKYDFPGKQQRGDHIFWSQMGEDDAPQGSSEGYRATVAPGRLTEDNY